MGPPSTTKSSSTTSRKPSTSTKTTTQPTTKTTKSTTKPTTTKLTTKRTTTDWRPETTSTELIATPSPQDGHSQTALIVGAVIGVIVLLAIIVVSVVTVKRRNIKIPGIDAVRGLINPGYSRFDDGGMVSLKELS